MLEAESSNPSYLSGLSKEQESLINKIARAVLDVSKKDIKDDQKLSTIKSIMTDLFLPTLSMIESLETKLVRLKKEKIESPSNEPKLDIETSRMVAALEGRVQELNQSNCYLERELVQCQREIEEYKVKVKDYDTLKESQISNTGTYSNNSVTIDLVKSLQEAHQCLAKSNSLLRSQIEAKDREFEEQKKLWDTQLRNVMALMEQYRNYLPPLHSSR